MKLLHFFIKVPAHFEINFPVDTGRKLNVHITFRRRLGRLLNVSCAFSLRPVSTGFVAFCNKIVIAFCNKVT